MSHWTKELFDEAVTAFKLPKSTTLEDRNTVKEWIKVELAKYEKYNRVAATIMVYARWRLATMGESPTQPDEDMCAGCVLANLADPEDTKDLCSDCPIQTCNRSSGNYSFFLTQGAITSFHMDFLNEANLAGIPVGYIPSPEEKI